MYSWPPRTRSYSLSIPATELPRVLMSQETDVDVQVQVIAFSTPFHGGLRCQEGVNVYLEEPLGDRVIVDCTPGRLLVTHFNRTLVHNRSPTGE